MIHDRVHLVAVSAAQRDQNRSVRYAATIHNGIDVERVSDEHSCSQRRPRVHRPLEPWKESRGGDPNRTSQWPAPEARHQTPRTRGTPVLGPCRRTASRFRRRSPRRRPTPQQGPSPRRRLRDGVSHSVARTLRTRDDRGHGMRNAGHRPTGRCCRRTRRTRAPPGSSATPKTKWSRRSSMLPSWNRATCRQCASTRFSSKKMAAA